MAGIPGRAWRFRSTHPSPSSAGSRRIAALFSLIGLFALPVAIAQQALAPQEALQAMSAAVRNLDYQGSFIYERNGELHALRLLHQGNGHDREKLVSLDGPRNVVLRDGSLITLQQEDGTTSLLPNRPGSRLLPLIPDPLASRFQRFYATVRAGHDRVAGYGAQVIDIQPRDGFRYGYRVWLEDDSHLPLKSALVDGAGNVVEQFLFVSLDIRVAFRADEFAAVGAPAAAMPVEGGVLGASAHWHVVDLPPGFRYSSGHWPMLAPTRSEHHVYSDGIASVSVYVELRDARQPPAADSATTRGALNIYSHDVGDVRVTALGDVPRATVRRMARSVQPIPARDPAH